MTTVSAVRVGVITTSVLAAAAVLLAQQGTRFRSSIDTVEVHVTVRAADGTLAKDLTKDDFELFDNGRRREVTVFSADVMQVPVEEIPKAKCLATIIGGEVVYQASDF